jgi:hypothetical protein
VTVHPQSQQNFPSSSELAAEIAAEVLKRLPKGDKEAIQPRLSASYHEAYYYRPYPLLMVLLELKNVGDTQTAATDFKADVRTSSKPVYPLLMPEGTTIHLRLGVPPIPTDMVFLLEEFIQYRATAKPIPPGVPVRGWLFFNLPKNSQPDGLAISFNDVYGRSYSIPLLSIKEIPPLPELESTQRFPDVTYPFRDRSIVEKIEKGRGGDILMLKP